MNKNASSQIQKYSPLARKAIREAGKIEKAIRQAEDASVELVIECLDRLRATGRVTTKPIRVAHYSESLGGHTIFVERREDGSLGLSYVSNFNLGGEAKREPFNPKDANYIYGIHNDDSAFRAWYRGDRQMIGEDLGIVLPLNVKIIDNLERLSRGLEPKI
ncbi:MAG: hypothetical protein Q7S06_02460 [Nanoarchaeota archaeon]|nr:hypothetical protein [Nanoarchaeota archaeon]